MNREEVNDFILNSQNTNILISHPTSYGKSKLALDKTNKVLENSQDYKILIVVPRLVLIDNWKDEFNKWHYSHLLDHTSFITYASYPKKSGEYDIIIYDEVHHLSQRCIEHIGNYKSKYNIMLSATVGYKLQNVLRIVFPNLLISKIGVRKAIDDNVLPDPLVCLIPLKLDNMMYSCEIIKNKSCKDEITVLYSERNKYKYVKNKKVIIKCTQQQYYDDICSLIDWYKMRSFTDNDKFFKLFLQKSGERLKWLSNQKTNIVRKMLYDKLNNARVITFCNSIKQTEELGKNCVNSKNKGSMAILDDFNSHNVNHITACDMLNEGCNLVDCQCGVYASLHSSNRLIIQQLGRLLRHPKPVLFIPYYENTREEEIVHKMTENYNPNLVRSITLQDIKDEILL